LVQVTTGSDVLLAPQGAVMNRLVRYNLSKADLVTAWAPHMADAAQRLGASSDGLFVLPRGIPFQRFASSRCQPPSDGEALRIICTRSLKADYNLDLLLKALPLVNDKINPIRLTIVGDGPHLEHLLSLTHQLGLQDRVRFLGFVPNEHLPALLADHHVYVSVIESDGVSASLMEAMATGLLPIAPNHPANSFWIRQNETGLLLNDLTPITVAEAFHEAISNIALRRRAWEENPKLVSDKADMHRNSKQYIARFRQLVKN
jgi:glycosyltransferase involved in cell wall biosynthesis